MDKKLALKIARKRRERREFEAYVESCISEIDYFIANRDPEEWEEVGNEHTTH